MTMLQFKRKIAANNTSKHAQNSFIKLLSLCDSHEETEKVKVTYKLVSNSYPMGSKGLGSAGWPTPLNLRNALLNSYIYK